MKKIHHLALVTNNLELTLNSLNIKKSDIQEVFIDHEQKNTIYFVYIKENNLWLEIIVPTNENSTTYNFAKKFGLGLHHLGFTTNNLEETEKNYVSRPMVFKIGNYKNKVECFGGEISTVFVAIKGLILEFVANVQKK
jgi:hypothetical protein|tara:strand:+ start:269 stop:682 length:414 start_codon:yes stop_codon:yes gene_type:complete